MRDIRRYQLCVVMRSNANQATGVFRIAVGTRSFSVWNNLSTSYVFYGLMRNRFHHFPGWCRQALTSVTAVAVALVVLTQTAIASSDARVTEGKKLAMERSKGNCLACHMIEDGELPGNLGPPLLAMKARFPSREALKEQICDATIRNTVSRMPPFCRHGILTEIEVELIVDYLYTL